VSLIAGFLVACSTAPQQPNPDTSRPPYLNPDFAIDRRVEDLISRMTLEEKVGQMLYDAPAVERLGIPEYNWWNEALHGVARAGRATVFPQAIGLAATWNTELMLRVATAISDEARAKHHESARRGRRGIYEGLTFWSPNINIFRDPRWGRGMETYGEDPFLTGALAVQFVRGLQGDDPTYLKTVATPKHYAVHSGPEPERHTFDAVVNERDLRETYLPAFRTSIIDAHAQSVMCAYNRYMGDPACASFALLEDILRGEWDFDGYVVSDCWAISDIYSHHKVVGTAAEAAAMSVAAGTDLNCGVAYDSLVVAVRQGLISEAAIDSSLGRLMRARFMLGMFDPPELVRYQSIPYSDNDSEKHRRLALETARQSIVLLKNQAGLLPLSKRLGTVAVIGPNADDVDVLLGNYNGLPSDPTTPLEGIRRAAGPETRVLYARGTDLAENMPSMVLVPAGVLSVSAEEGVASGLLAEYFDNHELEGSPKATQIDDVVDFAWWDEPPLVGMRPDSFSVRWTGILTVPTTGTYALGIRALGGARLFVDDSLVVEFSDRHVVLTQWRDIELSADRPNRIRIEYWDRRSDAVVQFVWSPPEPDLKEQALVAARQADAVILFMGLSPRLEGEEMPVVVPGFRGGDRLDIGLPASQRDLMRAVVELEKPTVLVLLNGSALAVNWAAENVPAIVEAWYPGQAAGTAVADVLFGDYNPAGRLPITFYKSTDQLPPFDDYDMEGRTYRYFWEEPLFPFGHGLSYTTFAYRDLDLPITVTNGDDIELSVIVENTGQLVGEEVVQLYVTDLDASTPVPIRSLQGFQRVRLEPGQTRRVLFTLSPRQLSMIDSEYRRVVEPGTFEISVGGKQPGFSGYANAPTTEVVTGRVRITGETLRLGQ
jgi:beta-glucosidase